MTLVNNKCISFEYSEYNTLIIQLMQHKMQKNSINS